MKNIQGFFDASVKGETAGLGAVILSDGKEIWHGTACTSVRYQFVHEGEGKALEMLLDQLSRMNIRDAQVYGDNKGVIIHASGKAKNHATWADPLYEKTKEIDARCQWIPRNKNAAANLLSRKAIRFGAKPFNPRKLGACMTTRITPEKIS